MVRHGLAVLLGVLAAAPAVAGEMKPDEARRFVAGKLFAFNCFEGTRGSGRIYNDGSVSGSIQFHGAATPRFVALPAGTLRVKGEKICASLRGMPMEPCFNLDQKDGQSFRGSIAGLGFAYCDFTRRSGRSGIVRASLTAPRMTAATPGARSAEAIPAASHE